MAHEANLASEAVVEELETLPFRTEEVLQGHLENIPKIASRQPPSI